MFSINIISVKKFQIHFFQYHLDMNLIGAREKFQIYKNGSDYQELGHPCSMQYLTDLYDTTALEKGFLYLVKFSYSYFPVVAK